MTAPSLMTGAPHVETNERLLGWLQARADDARPWLVFHQTGTPDVLAFRDVLPLARRWAKALHDAGVGPEIGRAHV
jgi:hypothetical protein